MSPSHVCAGRKMLGQLLSAVEARITSLQPVELCNVYWGLGLMVGAA